MPVVISPVTVAGDSVGQLTVRSEPPRGSRRSTHCHSAMNVRGLHVQVRVAVRWARPTRPGGEWQCAIHCHSVSSVPYWYAQGPSGSAIGTFGDEWKCSSHCHSAVNVLSETFRPQWQCDGRGRHARGRVAQDQGVIPHASAIHKIVDTQGVHLICECRACHTVYLKLKGICLLEVACREDRLATIEVDLED